MRLFFSFLRFFVASRGLFPKNCLTRFLGYCGRSYTAANTNADSDANLSSLANLSHQIWDLAALLQNGKGGTASLRSRTCFKRNAVFRARLRVFLCIFYIKKGIWYVSKRACIHIWYVSKPSSLSRNPLFIILKGGGKDPPPPRFQPY